MSIALNARIKELETRVAELERKTLPAADASVLVDGSEIPPLKVQFANAAPVKRKPGRPPKNG